MKTIMETTFAGFMAYDVKLASASVAKEGITKEGFLVTCGTKVASFGSLESAIKFFNEKVAESVKSLYL